MVPQSPPVSGPRGLYLHVPYCAHRCPYCDFYLVVGKPDRALTTRLLAEWDAQHTLLGSTDGLTSIYLGGGTPGLLPTDDLATLLQGIQARLPLLPNAEVTLEANPNDVSETSVVAWREAGVTRVSLGIQSLDDATLRFLGRDHSGDDGVRAATLLKTAGFQTFSVDLIFGAPDQTEASLRREVHRLAELAPHVSAYCLTYEPGTRLQQFRERGKFKALDADAEADRYELVRNALREHGFSQYEVSSHTQKGHAAIHNRLYWQGAITLGLGPAAASYLRFEDGRALRWRNEPNLDAYLSGKIARVDEDPLEPQAALIDRVYSGLRDMERGVSLAQLETEHGAKVPNAAEAALVAEEEAGALEKRGERHWRLTPAGALVADRVARAVVGEAE